MRPKFLRLSARLSPDFGSLGRAACLLLVSVGLGLQSFTARAAEGGPAVSASAKVADGRPWRLRMDDGHTTTLVLYENGTGSMTGGPMQLSPKWRPIPQGLCLKPMPLMAERCVTLVQTKNGFVGSKDGATVFTLER